jgi:hypothetical protein
MDAGAILAGFPLLPVELSVARAHAAEGGLLLLLAIEVDQHVPLASTNHLVGHASQ